MGKNITISSDIRSKIDVMGDLNHSHAFIAKTLGVSRSSVARILKLKNETGSLKPKKRPGKAKLTSKAVDRRIRRFVMKNPFVSAAKVKEHLNLDISVRTVRHRLAKDLQFKTRVPLKKPLLTAKQIKARLAFCAKYKQWTPEQWKQVLFSDESTFMQFRDVSKLVRVPEGVSPLNNKYTKKVVKHSPSVMVWGCFGYNGRGSLYFLEKGEKMNAAKYLAMLQEKLPPFMTILSCTVFQQDGAPCHTAKTVMKWLKSKYDVLDWPGNFPDLNPIENLWLILKDKVASKQPKSMDDLKRIIVQCWSQEITVEYCQNLIMSMPKRIENVIKNKGYPTKY